MKHLVTAFIIALGTVAQAEIPTEMCLKFSEVSEAVAKARDKGMTAREAIKNIPKPQSEADERIVVFLEKIVLVAYTDAKHLSPGVYGTLVLNECMNAD